MAEAVAAAVVGAVAEGVGTVATFYAAEAVVMVVATLMAVAAVAAVAAMGAAVVKSKQNYHFFHAKFETRNITDA